MTETSTTYTLGIDIGSTTVKVALLDGDLHIIFSDYRRHYANIQETLADLLREAREKTGPARVLPVITGSGGLTLSSHLKVPFVQEVVAVASALQDYAPQTDVAIELGGEDAKIIYFTGGIDQRMNGICAGGTGSFIDQMASLLQTDAAGLNEYAKRGNKLVGIVRITTETLSGIPSIVYGLFGSLFFVRSLHLDLSLLSGALTLSIMILPLIMRSTEEALIAVPDSYREGSFGLGAGKLRTVFRIVLPSAVPGILSGIILGIGRIVGESAALIYTAGTVAKVATSVLDSTRTLSVHMYVISGEGLYIDQAYATAVILLVVVIIINGLSSLVAKKIGGENNNG